MPGEAFKDVNQIVWLSKALCWLLIKTSKITEGLRSQFPALGFSICFFLVPCLLCTHFLWLQGSKSHPLFTSSSAKISVSRVGLFSFWSLLRISAHFTSPNASPFPAILFKEITQSPPCCGSSLVTSLPLTRTEVQRQSLESQDPV